MKTPYQKTKKPRHIVNGRAFGTASEAGKYIEDNGFELERLEVIFKVNLYHVKSKPTRSTGLSYNNASENEPSLDY